MYRLAIKAAPIVRLTPNDIHAKIIIYPMPNKLVIITAAIPNKTPQKESAAVTAKASIVKSIKSSIITSPSQSSSYSPTHG